MDTNETNIGNPPVNPNKGYKIIIIILAILVVIISALFYLNVSDLKESQALLNEEKIALTEDLSATVTELGNIKTENDSIGKSLDLQKHRGDSLLKALSREKEVSRATIRKYEKELGTLRSIMKKYIFQIDSLNQLNQALVSENLQVKTELKRTALRADAAEEQSQELTAQVRKGSQITARDISVLVSRKPNGSMVKIKNAKSMRIDFALSQNALAKPGERNVYARVITPDGYPLAESQSALFDFEGEKLSYTANRSIDYQNDNLKISLFYDCKDLIPGKYIVEIYMDGLLIGSNRIDMK